MRICITEVVGGLTATTIPLSAVAGVATFSGLQILKTKDIKPIFALKHFTKMPAE